MPLTSSDERLPRAGGLSAVTSNLKYNNYPSNQRKPRMECRASLRERKCCSLQKQYSSEQYFPWAICMELKSYTLRLNGSIYIEPKMK
jgi:hypothetical protein